MDIFREKFLTLYLAGGFGSMAKRDIDALILNLLDEYGFDAGAPMKDFSPQRMSIELRAPVSRIKTLRYEAALKYADKNGISVKERMLKIIAKAGLDLEQGKVSLIIEDIYTRNWLQGLLKDSNLVVDTSFNSEIVKVDADGLCDVLAMLFDADTVSMFRVNIEKLKAKQGKLTFTDVKKEFLNGAVNGLGKAAATLPLTALLGFVSG